MIFIYNGEKRDAEAIIRGEISKEYIHVRARRGQATDSHSIAERVPSLTFLSLLA